MHFKLLFIITGLLQTNTFSAQSDIDLQLRSSSAVTSNLNNNSNSNDIITNNKPTNRKNVFNSMIDSLINAIIPISNDTKSTTTTSNAGPPGEGFWGEPSDTETDPSIPYIVLDDRPKSTTNSAIKLTDETPKDGNNRDKPGGYPSDGFYDPYSDETVSTSTTQTSKGTTKSLIELLGLKTKRKPTTTVSPLPTAHESMNPLSDRPYKLSSIDSNIALHGSNDGLLNKDYEDNEDNLNSDDPYKVDNLDFINYISSDTVNNAKQFITFKPDWRPPVPPIIPIKFDTKTTTKPTTTATTKHITTERQFQILSNETITMITIPKIQMPTISLKTTTTPTPTTTDMPITTSKAPEMPAPVINSIGSGNDDQVVIEIINPEKWEMITIHRNRTTPPIVDNFNTSTTLPSTTGSTEVQMDVNNTSNSNIKNKFSGKDQIVDNKELDSIKTIELPVVRVSSNDFDKQHESQTTEANKITNKFKQRPQRMTSKLLDSITNANEMSSGVKLVRNRVFRSTERPKNDIQFQINRINKFDQKQHDDEGDFKEFKPVKLDLPLFDDIKDNYIPYPNIDLDTLLGKINSILSATKPPNGEIVSPNYDTILLTLSDLVFPTLTTKTVPTLGPQPTPSTNPPVIGPQMSNTNTDVHKHQEYTTSTTDKPKTTTTLTTNEMQMTDKSKNVETIKTVENSQPVTLSTSSSTTTSSTTTTTTSTPIITIQTQTDAIPIQTTKKRNRFPWPVKHNHENNRITLGFTASTINTAITTTPSTPMTSSLSTQSTSDQSVSNKGFYTQSDQWRTTANEDKTNKKFKLTLRPLSATLYTLPTINWPIIETKYAEPLISTLTPLLTTHRRPLLSTPRLDWLPQWIFTALARSTTPRPPIQTTSLPPIIGPMKEGFQYSTVHYVEELPQEVVPNDTIGKDIHAMDVELNESDINYITNYSSTDYSVTNKPKGTGSGKEGNIHGNNSGQSYNGIGTNNGQGGIIIGANSGNGRRPGGRRPVPSHLFVSRRLRDSEVTSSSGGILRFGR
ncbi:mucin-5AC-like [Oppia nitens]|uniref:mucin-5AC-like n=1 Tax=Oppia nitens TaxID=1686743 RepID=UPI0023DA6EA3|nr:mucin-5AC-like [Oppia nitens]